MNRRRRCAAHILSLLSASFGGALVVAATSSTRADGLIEGIDSYADAVTGRSTAKWVGQRVAWPVPSARPLSVGRLDSMLAPVSVHATSQAGAARLQAVLMHADYAHALLAASGLFALHGDGGQAGTFQRDLYVVDTNESGAQLDASGPVWDLDGARAFAILDARVPATLLGPCTAQALIEAELYELDPAEAASVRQGSAAYVTTRLLGESCPLPPQPQEQPDTLHDAQAFAVWLSALDARYARGSGTFVENMWQFARQRTWEGTGLRGSPDLLEAIGKSLELGHERLEETAGNLALRLFQQRAQTGARADVSRVTWSELPAHRPAVSPLLPLGSAYLMVELEQPRPGQRLSVWSRGESPVRWVLSATRLDATGTALGTVNAAVRKYPESELHVELDATTSAVLIAITSLGNGKIDADLPSEGLARSVRLIVDRGR